MATQALRHGNQQFVADIVAVLVVDGLEAVQVEQVHRHQVVGVTTLQAVGQLRIQAAAVGQAGQRIGVGERVHGVTLAVRIECREVQRLAAQAQHTHEQQYVDGCAELKRVHHPEIGGHPALHQAHHYDGCQAIGKPCDQQGGADRVFLAHPPQCCRNAEQRWQRADQDHENRGATGRQKVENESQAYERGDRSTGVHHAWVEALRGRPHQDVVQEKKRPRQSHQPRRDARMAPHPHIARPEKLRANTKKLDGKARATQHYQRIVGKQPLALAGPLDQAVHQQAKRQPDQQPLQHLLALGQVQSVGKFADTDGQDHGPQRADADQHVIALACLQVQQHGRDTARQGGLVGRAHVAQQNLLKHLAFAGEVNIHFLQ